MSSSLWKNLGGTILDLFQIGRTGPKLKNTGGVLEIRNSPDTAYATLRSATDNTTSTNNVVTVAGHETLDSLVHNLAETCYHQYVRDGNNRITDIIVWTDNTLTVKVREVNLTRSGGRVSQIVSKQYNSSGVLIQTITSVITRSGGRVSNIQDTETLWQNLL